DGVEFSLRHKDDRALIFVLNHNAQAARVDLGTRTFRDLLTDATLTGPVQLEAYGVYILVEQR
ncbi:partial Beta-galactosidase BgaP, partial [Anaerolineae bacterium]